MMRSSPILPSDFSDWKQKNKAFQDIAASYDNEVTPTGAGEPKLVLGYAPSFFRILGVSPEIGRKMTTHGSAKKPEG